MTGNSNFISHILRLRANPVDSVSDWAINDYLSSTVVGAVLIPLNGAQDFFGNDEIWTQLIVATTLQF